MVMNDTENSQFCGLLKIFQILEEMAVFTEVSTCHFMLRARVLKSWEIPLTGSVVRTKTWSYCYICSLTIKKFSSGCMETYDPDMSSGPFVQVDAILISTTSRRKAGLILSVSVASAILFWHWDVFWHLAIDFIILKSLEVALRRKKAKSKSQHL